MDRYTIRGGFKMKASDGELIKHSDYEKGVELLKQYKISNETLTTENLALRSKVKELLTPRGE